MSGYDRVIWARGTPVNMVMVRLTLRRILGEREGEVREEEGFWVGDQSLVVIDGDGVRVISNTRPVLRNDNIGVLGVFMDDGIVTRRGGRVAMREKKRQERGVEGEMLGGEQRRRGEK